MSKLAIIIPYFKPTFFRSALLSIKKQTDDRYNIYIGDDNSLDDPRQIINDVFGDSTVVSYKKFYNNLGGLHLTKQWERCIEMSVEPYVWLFSDDDVMPPDAVERFYKFIDLQPDAGLMRFNLDVINDSGEVFMSGAPHPLHETSRAFMNRRLAGECISAACEYIFTKEVYQRENGFVDFPVGWASDDATWMKFGAKNGIYSIPGAPVLWRFGNVSISSSTKNHAEKTKASLMFVRFIRDKGADDRHLQLYWLFLQLNVQKYSNASKVKFFLNLIRIKMFSPVDLIKFGSATIAKKVFNY